MINVTKSYLPPIEEYQKYLSQIWESSWLTNQGPLAQELEFKLKEKLGVKNLLFVSNGTIAIQLAIKALDLKGEIITTPFSYVATTTSILWENCTPVFADIDPETCCINPLQIESLITKKTSAILATHVYGIPCDVDSIAEIAKKHNLKIIYDGAHAFGVKYKTKSVFEHGDISTLSFHATKLFHTVEGGAIIVQDDELYKKILLYRSFGHIGDDYYSIGINGKNSEFHAAMGLCNLPYIDDIITRRKTIAARYLSNLKTLPLAFPEIPESVEYNYAYFPIFFQDEKELLTVREKLSLQNINTRRYFYPSLNKLPYINSINNCPVSEDIAKRVLSLPFYPQLTFEEVDWICSLIKGVFEK
jgi:dTDP-4-amino-4,6-dideoxygalactose transaminase